MFIGQDLLHTTQGEHLVSPLLLPLPCFLFHFVFVYFYYSFCPSFLHNIAFYFSSLFYFLNSPLPLLPAVLYSLFSLAFLPLLLFFCHPFVSLSPSPPAVRFYFVLFWDLFVSPAVLKPAPSLRQRRCSSLLCTWLSTRTAARRLIETCVSKLLMFSEALYCR